MNQDLVAFLYLLMRDTVVVGEMARLRNQVLSNHKPVVFSNKYLEAYSQDLVGSLVARNGKIDPFFAERAKPVEL